MLGTKAFRACVIIIDLACWAQINDIVTPSFCLKDDALFAKGDCLFLYDIEILLNDHGLNVFLTSSIREAQKHFDKMYIGSDLDLIDNQHDVQYLPIWCIYL